MAYSKNQNEPKVPVTNDEKRSSTDLLPRFFRTNPNRKFLNATVDQLIQQGAVEKLNGYIGRLTAKSSKSSDIFLSAKDKARQDYQLEIAAVVEDYLGNTNFFKDYIDHINHINVLGGVTNNHNRLNYQEFYSWNPHVDWDKFVNFQQYYWLPFGPDVINVAGQQKQIISTYKIETVDEEDNYAYLFTPNGLTRNPTLKLFRGQTYIFDINAPGNPFSIKTRRVEGSLYRYNVGIAQNAVEQGQLIFEVPENAPDVLFYVSENAVDTGGVFQILDIEENTFIDVEAEILGKKTYTIPNVLGSPLPLSNGMKINFTGEVVPEKYSNGYWYVEGVGNQIKLISEKDLEIRSTYVEQSTLLFDDLPFDQVPFSEIGSLPNRKDYITINRSALDNNAWSRYNRWFHQDVIIASAKANLKQAELNQKARATRPIIEFNPGIKLYNHGVKSKTPIDVIDNFTKDAFSTVEGSIGYNVDGIDLADGMRIIFNAETDILVKNKIYKVNFIKVNVPGRDINFNAETDVNASDSTIVFQTEHGLSSGNQVTYFINNNDPIQGLVNRKLYWVKTITPFIIELYSNPELTKKVEIFNISSGTHRFELFLGLRKQIYLTEETDSLPQIGESVSVRLGVVDKIFNNTIVGNQGQTYWFNGDKWILSQIKLNVNQPPLFDLFDENGISFGDLSVYEGSTFIGNKIFSYKLGSGANDSELKFPLSYQNINNIGDIVFEFNLLNDSFSYKIENSVSSKNTDVGYLKLVEDLERYTFQNGWIKSSVIDYQPVVRIYKGSEQKNDFLIDVFNNINLLEDLKIKVYKNSIKLKDYFDYIVSNETVYKKITLMEDLEDTDIISIKCYTKQPKNEKGYYEFPINLQNNPLNENINIFTLGEVLNHVETIVDNLENFVGRFPGQGNLRDVGSVSQLGTRFVQHSSPLNLALYHLGSKNANVIKAIDKAMDDYGKFKRSFILASEESNFDGDVRDHVNNILRSLNENKPKASPYYLSDMFAYSAFNRIEYIVLDGRIKKYPLTKPFNLNSLSNKSVLIYLNGVQLVQGRDYIFGNEEFFEVLATLQEDDILEAIEYESTDGCFCPSTPSKLGIYPKFVPEIFIDRSYKDRVEIFKVPNVLPETTKQFNISNVNPVIKQTDVLVFVNGQKKKFIDDYSIIQQSNSFKITFNDSLTRSSIVEVKIPTVVIQGHDGSRTIAFDDYRDQLLLEFEKRIFNNIKVNYDRTIFDILNFIPGYTRKTAYSIEEFNKVISPSLFKWSQLIGKDFSKMIGFDQDNAFTYNYEGCYSKDGFVIPKYWRGMYYYFLDTDRPQTHPWECLGFSIEPSWWQEVYGPGPYTGDNQLVWDDIRQGIIREPGKPVIRDPKLEKSILSYGAPSDQLGNLLPPFDSPFINGRPTFPENNGFDVGDFGPIEFAWKISSYYPFALLRAILILSPGSVFGVCYDRSRIVKNISNQLVYSHTNKRIKLKDVLVPTVANSTEERTYTAGLVNYVIDYLSGENLDRIQSYKNDLKTLTNKLSTRLGGFTSKPKYKILLDSKNPAASSGIFVPEENYKVDLSISSPIKRASYSGVIITKLEEGFEVKGYDYSHQYFTVFKHRTSEREITVGGISESYTFWQENQIFVAGKVIRYDNNYYRVKVTHKTTSTFDSSLYAILSELPISGGRTVWIRKDWNKNNPITIPYNTVFSSIQEVADFLQGYSAYLENEGFIFDTFINNFSTVANWITSIKEFLYWTTQNWSIGSVISLSPAANKVSFKSETSAVDSIVDQFYDYNIFKVDGKKLEPEFLNANRFDGRFDLEPSNTSEGIYCAVFYLIQKEHVVILDNRTIFNDVIFDSEAGFRQERLKILGYVTVGWDGSFNVPGFLFDHVKIYDWKPWEDYYLGDVVKYKEFYYSAKKFIPGAESFNYEDWFIIRDKLESKLLSNWDYRAEQFTDFYDLDTDNIDAGQQKLAQHLIGYQKRQYIENIINNDVSQYKFYQGMISEKGTQNVLNKLFDVLSASNTESLTFNEEWAVRVGDYGAVDSFDEVEFILDEKEFKVNPQPFEIIDKPNFDLIDFVYRQRFSDIYIKPKFKFDQNIFEVIKPVSFLRTSGYLKSQDAVLSVDSLEDLEEIQEFNFFEGDYIHTAFEKNDWNVYRINKLDIKILDINYGNSTKFTCDTGIKFNVGDYLRIESKQLPKLASFYKILSVEGNSFYTRKVESNDTLDPNILVFKLESQRIKEVDNLNDFIDKFSLKDNEIVWSDKNENDLWAVYQSSKIYSKGSILNSDPVVDCNFGLASSISENGNICAIASNKDVVVYEKGSNDNAWRSTNRFFTDNLGTELVSFGKVVKLSKDGEWLAIAAPQGNPSSSLDPEQGFVYLYKRDYKGKYGVVAQGNQPKEFTETSSDPLAPIVINYGKAISFTKTATGYLMAISSSQYVFVYEYTNGSEVNNWNLIKTIVGDEYSNFGASIEFSDLNDLYISAPDYTDVEEYPDVESFPTIGKFRKVYLATSPSGKIYRWRGTKYTEISIAPDHGKVYIYKYSNNYNDPQELPEINNDDNYEKFGSSIAVSADGNYIAVGCNLFDNISEKSFRYNSGAVFVYKNNNNIYELNQKIITRGKENNEKFGSYVGFMNNSETLVILSPNSKLLPALTFDVHSSKYEEFTYETENGIVQISKYIKDQNSKKNLSSTTFDNNSTKFVSNKLNVGRIDIYDRFNTKFAYGETLENISGSNDDYGYSVSVGSNVVLASSPHATDSTKLKSGKFYSYKKPANSFSWKILYKEEKEVDVSQIKKSYLYNRKTNEIVKYLDVIDVNQGKIPGVADQEIKYKTYYDPAIYVKGTIEVNVDNGLNWTDDQVGMLWWDLNRAKFVERNLGDNLYKSINSNVLYKTASIDIYEWVKSDLLPSRWDELADTEEGLALGISGNTKYGDDVYSTKSYYDPISQSVKTTYYYWVKNKKTSPFVSGRNLSAFDISRLIADPAGVGYPCIIFNNSNSFNLVNIEKYTEDKNVVLNLQQWLVDNKTNYHSEWKLISENKNTIIPTYIEQKWFHSLIGKDDAGRQVPDYKIPLKQRYGVEFKPRQSMFVNRIEPLKQLISETNKVLKTILITDTYDLTDLKLEDKHPSEINCEWDVAIDTEIDLRIVSASNFRLPVLAPIVIDGKIVDFDIINSGFGYSRFRVYETDINQNPVKWYGPEIKILGNGINAKILSIINSVGSVVGISIVHPGEGYDSNTVASIRNYSVLIKSDSASFNSWAVYAWNSSLTKWDKIKSQSYDVKKYWKYVDWYKEGYSEYTKIDNLFENYYQLLINPVPIGNIVKLKNIGSGGWVLLRKVNDIKTVDYTQNFETVGRQEGTIEFLEAIYKPLISYDTALLDSSIYDNTPVEELRIILKTLRDKILINEYRIEYINLFINSIRYILHEQIFVDWVFKTSFVKASHNLGNLTQKTNYKNDNLENFEDYVKEVKPYRTKIREYVSKYDSLDNTKTLTTDFDIIPVIEETYKVKPIKVNISNNAIVTNEDELDIVEPVINKDPWLSWYSNVGFEITDIVVIDGGEGYINRPKIEIIGDRLSGGTPAIAKSYIVKGSVSRIDIINPGSKWVSPPQIIFKGSIRQGGRPARAIAKIGNSVIRSSLLQIKFDRLSKVYQVSSLNEEETFSGVIVSGSRSQFNLKWSPDIRFNKHSVVINGIEILKSEYRLETVSKEINNTTRYSGVLVFNNPPIKGSVITVKYFKNFDHLSAVDRINFFYDPQTGQLGKDLSLLMTGIDYGGVNITGIDFKNTYGWDALPWLNEAWDVDIPGYKDYMVTISDPVLYQFRLPYVPEDGEEITIYVSKIDTDATSPTYLKYLPAVRLDDPNYLTILQTNQNAIMKTFVGDGETDIIVLPLEANLEFFVDTVNDILYGDRVIFRKIDSDGSFDPRDEDYDTKLSGGDLAYTSAVGINPDDINLDGDDLISPMTSYAPEEVVPGQIMDTLSIKVFSRPSGGCPNIMFKIYIADGLETNFFIGQYFNTDQSVIVKLGDIIQQLGIDYSIDRRTNTVNFVTAPEYNKTISIISLSFNSSTMLDTDYFISDGETLEYITKAPWFPDIGATVLVDGTAIPYDVFSTNSVYANSQNGETWRARVGIRFPTVLPAGAIINYMIDRKTLDQTASVVKSEVINYSLSSSTYNLTNPVGTSLPYEPNVLVKADNSILRPPSYSYFTMTDKNLVYKLLDSKYQNLILDFSDIVVYSGNNQKLSIGIDYIVSYKEFTPVYSADPNNFSLIGGSGYAEGDIVTLDGGTIEGSPTQFEVQTVNASGQILYAEMINIGTYKEIPPDPLTVSGTAGTGASVTVNFVTVKDDPAISIELRPFRYVEGGKLTVGITTDADYKFESPTTIKFNKQLLGVSKLEVISFYNHTVLGVERTEELLNQTPILDQTSPEYYEFRGKSGGIFKLRSTIADGNFVWVIKSGTLLTLNVDYELLEDKQTIRLIQYPATEDVIQLIAFTNTIVTDTFGYMQFKDIMNRVHYKRLNKEKSTVLIQELLQKDKEIYVADTTVLDVPNPALNLPGIVEINGERIEYFAIEGSALTQLRRGTLGTGIPEKHVVDSLVQGLGVSETIPYKDEQTSITVIADGISNEISLPYVPTKNTVEVFVGGYRLKKNEYTLYSNPAMPYSPEGDAILPAEFEASATNAETGVVKLTTVPTAGVKVMIVRKQGHIWNDLGKRLGNSENKIAKFIRETNVGWPT